MAPNSTPSPVQREELLFTALQVLRDGSVPSDLMASAMTPVLTDRGLRDALLVLAAQGHIGWNALGEAAWITYSAQRDTNHDAATDALVVAGACAWAHGDTASAAACIAVAQTHNPDHRLGQLLGQAIRSGMPPTGWVTSAAALSIDECIDFTG